MNFSRTTPAHCVARTERGERNSLGASLTVDAPVAQQARTFSKAGCWNVGAQVVREPISHGDAENRLDHWFWVASQPEIPLRASGITFAGGVWHAELELTPLASAIRSHTGNELDRPSRESRLVRSQLRASSDVRQARLTERLSTASVYPAQAGFIRSGHAWRAWYGLPLNDGRSGSISMRS